MLSTGPNIDEIDTRGRKWRRRWRKAAEGRHAPCHRGPCAERTIRVRKYSDLSRLYGALPERGEVPEARCALHLRHQGHANDQFARSRMDRVVGRSWNCTCAVRARRDFDCAVILPQGWR